MKNYFLGIDIGTSSVKLLLSTKSGETISAKSEYETNNIAGWCDAIKRCLDRIKGSVPLSLICAVSFSSQVGTYITDKGDIIPWFSSAGEQELNEIKLKCSEACFVEEIGMLHPELISYPLSRLLYIKRNFPEAESVIMPKEAVIFELTGNLVTDTFSQRGICNPIKNEYSEKLLKLFNIGFKLPKILNPTDIAGYITENASKTYGLPEGIPVYVGCNDFYAGLLGMGVLKNNTVFELSGTSEHLGVITKARVDGKIISGKYFNGFATYGGTKSSGTSCDFAIKNFGIVELDENLCITNQPIFLPYLKGERAPVYDENARGVFFGITDKTTKSDMAYAILEGVVFSLYHISEDLPIKNVSKIITGGGSAADKLMAKIKAELFDCEILRAKDNNSSALGAVIIAMVAHKAFGSFNDAIVSAVEYVSVAKPDGANREKLLKRFEIYKKLYFSLKSQFEEFSKI